MHADDVAVARRAHDTLVHALHSLENAEKNAVRCFADVYHRRLFRCLGYSSIHHYATEKLGFSPSKAAQFVRLAKDLERLPALAAAVDQDEVSWTKARVIGAIATPQTERAWVARARTTTRRELQREVRQARKPKAPAAQVSLLDGRCPGRGSASPVRVRPHPAPGRARAETHGTRPPRSRTRGAVPGRAHRVGRPRTRRTDGGEKLHPGAGAGSGRRVPVRGLRRRRRSHGNRVEAPCSSRRRGRRLRRRPGRWPRTPAFEHPTAAPTPGPGP